MTDGCFVPIVAAGWLVAGLLTGRILHHVGGDKDDVERVAISVTAITAWPVIWAIVVVAVVGYTVFRVLRGR